MIDIWSNRNTEEEYKRNIEKTSSRNERNTCYLLRERASSPQSSALDCTIGYWDTVALTYQYN